MYAFLRFDPSNPQHRYWRWLKRKLRNLLLFAIAFIVMSWMVGIPHVQTTYSYIERPGGGIPKAGDKTDAWYISVTGWQYVRNGVYSDRLPFILFIPWKDCVDVERLRDRLSEYLSFRKPN
ncbi:MAG: hypothetical protein R3C19_25610 [Planctomycetaceae bacterium]